MDQLQGVAACQTDDVIQKKWLSKHIFLLEISAQKYFDTCKLFHISVAFILSFVDSNTFTDEDRILLYSVDFRYFAFTNTVDRQINFIILSV
jgi:hypothetical protein